MRQAEYTGVHGVTFKGPEGDGYTNPVRDLRDEWNAMVLRAGARNVTVSIPTPPSSGEPSRPAASDKQDEPEPERFFWALERVGTDCCPLPSDDPGVPVYYAENASGRAYVTTNIHDAKKYADKTTATRDTPNPAILGGMHFEAREHGWMHKPAAPKPTPLQESERDAFDYLGRLIEAFDAEPLPTLMGRCTQVDNILAADPKPDAVAQARDKIERAARALLIHEQDSVYAGRGRIYKCPNCAARGEKGADGGWVTPIVHTNFVASDVRCPWGLLHDALATEQAEREGGLCPNCGEPPSGHLRYTVNGPDWECANEREGGQA